MQNKLIPYILVFIASFCLMVIEIIAGRIIAPYVGVSLYTWTSIIGVVLLGITLGNWVGGRIADAYPRQKTFGPIFLLSALSSIFILFIVPSWQAILKTQASLPLLITIYSLITFFPIAFFLSFVTPLAIKIELNRLERTGRTVGNIYGTSAAGSIIGTFVSGFWLISSLGTYRIVWSIFALLSLMGFYFFITQARKKITSLIILLLILSPLGVLSFSKKGICESESRYYCIRINEFFSGENKGLALSLDLLEHGHLYAPEYDPFGDDYVRLFGILIDYKFKQNDNFKVMAIGGGAYILPRYVINNYPNAQVTVLEIDPKVTQVNYEKLNLKPNQRLKIIHQDARFAMNFLKSEKFDFIFADAFGDFIVPYHLTTREFLEKEKEFLNQDGIYAINIIDSPKTDRFLASTVLTTSAVFSNTYLFPLTKRWSQLPRRTVVVAGLDKPIEEKKMKNSNPLNDNKWNQASKEVKDFLRTYISGPELEKHALQKKGIVLTDNFVPVENMLAPIYSQK